MLLGLIEEKEKNKDWILDQIKKNRVKLKISPTENSFEILDSCSSSIVNKMYETLLEDEEFLVEEVNILSKTLHWFFIDIVGSSDPKIPVKNQARMINLLNSLIRRTETFKNRDRESTFIQSTGDGMAIGFADNPEKPLKLAIQVHKMFRKYNNLHKEKDRLHTRIGIDSGPVYFINDVEEKETVWGPGIIMARRVMDLCGTDQIFASRRIGDDISKLSPEYKEIMHQIGDYSIKHGEQLVIYNIYGKDFGNNIAPRKGRVKKEKHDLLFDEPNFEYNCVELKLDITNIETMMTHHTWIWDMRNITKIPLQEVFYGIAGDTEKDFPDLNVKITDEDNNKLENITLDVNKNHEKKFLVKLSKPVKRNQRVILKLEYDWEEPYRVFEYVFSTKCKKFKYTFTAPRELQLKNRVLEVIRELGIKKRAEPSPKIKYKSDKTVITWENDKKQQLQRSNAFEFHW